MKFKICGSCDLERDIASFVNCNPHNWLIDWRFHQFRLLFGIRSSDKWSSGRRLRFGKQFPRHVSRNINPKKRTAVVIRTRSFCWLLLPVVDSRLVQLLLSQEIKFVSGLLLSVVLINFATDPAFAASNHNSEWISSGCLEML